MVRGGVNRRSGMRSGVRNPFKKSFVPRHPFDLTLSEVSFPKVNAFPDDSLLTSV